MTARSTARHLDPVQDPDDSGVTATITAGGHTANLDELAEHIADMARRAVIDGEFTIAARDLLPPLQAVLAHTHDDVDSAMHRVRLTCTGTGDVLLSATSGVTMAVARIPSKLVDTTDPGVVWTCDLTPEDAKLIGRLFKPAKDTALDVKITAADGQVTVTDVTGMFIGRALTVPQPHRDEDNDPDVIHTLRQHLLAGATTGPQYRATPGAAWTRIGASSAALGQGPVVDTGTAGSFIARIGSEFIAVVSAVRSDEDAESRTSRSWMGRLPTGDPDLFSDGGADA